MSEKPKDSIVKRIIDQFGGDQEKWMRPYEIIGSMPDVKKDVAYATINTMCCRKPSRLKRRRVYDGRNRELFEYALAGPPEIIILRKPRERKNPPSPVTIIRPTADANVNVGLPDIVAAPAPLQPTTPPVRPPLVPMTPPLTPPNPPVQSPPVHQTDNPPTASAPPTPFVDALQTMIGAFATTLAGAFERALLDALNSDAVRKALTVRIEQDERIVMSGNPVALDLNTILNRVATVTTEPRPEPQQEPPASTERSPRIVIAGALKGHQKQELMSEFKDVFDLRFYHPDEAVPRLVNMSRQAARVIVLTDLIKHKHVMALDAERIPYERVGGGISRVKEHLTHLFASV